MSRPLIILDNGAHTAKVGVLHKHEEPLIVQNAVARSKGDKRTYFGHEIALCRDYSSLNYRLPFEKGYLVDWDAQKAVWDGIFSTEVLSIDTTQASLLLTEPYFNLPNIQDIYDQMIFEEYEFHSYYRCTPASMISSGLLFSSPDLPPAVCTIVVDSGFSFTHIVPIINGQIIWKAVKRLDVGGKLLTNHLKELVSFRQWNMMDETFIMNQVKETCCFVSTNFQQDTETCRIDPKRNPVVQEYILPDLSTNRKGRVRRTDDIVAEADQILVMNNERFTVPELLFRPDDIGLDQAGLASTIATSISLLPSDLQGMFWANIGLIGGNSKFRGLHDRLLAELRTLAPVGCEVLIYESADPVIEVYKSAYAFAATNSDVGAADVGFLPRAITKAEYMENGSSISRRKFRDWKSAEELEREAYGLADNQTPLVDLGQEASAVEGAAVSQKERDNRKESKKASGRGRHQREEPRSTQRGADRSQQGPMPTTNQSVGSRPTRNRTIRAGGVK
ncbi:actin-domain-containing protein [Crepidotus variabilis]|uniref:Actin-like protein ARP6 n=1 Tax=Crepidotus variabilis TaxID=179855 RepID=A0A9P6EEY4_9AGAR|nr:actin-domain-containing protein [Crepidotus variabilis]